MIPFSLLLLPLISAVDLCGFIDEDYCFYFGESSCYQKICECETAKCKENCTLPVWCKEGGVFHINETSIPEISLECADLKEKCLEKKYFNGFCFFHQKRCSLDDEVEKKSKEHFVITENCPKWKSTCERKWKKHFACRKFRKFCRKSGNETEIEFTTNQTMNSTGLEGKGRHWERNMKKRCREWRKDCSEDQNSATCKRVHEKCGRLSHSEDEIEQILGGGENLEKEEERGPHWERNMIRRCREWRKKCRKDKNSSACQRIHDRCSNLSTEDENSLFSNATHVLP